MDRQKDHEQAYDADRSDEMVNTAMASAPAKKEVQIRGGLNSREGDQ